MLPKTGLNSHKIIVLYLSLYELSKKSKLTNIVQNNSKLMRLYLYLDNSTVYKGGIRVFTNIISYPRNMSIIYHTIPMSKDGRNGITRIDR